MAPIQTVGATIPKSSISLGTSKPATGARLSTASLSAAVFSLHTPAASIRESAASSPNIISRIEY